MLISNHKHATLKNIRAAGFLSLTKLMLKWNDEFKKRGAVQERKEGPLFKSRL